MNYRFMRFPGGKHKAVTFSYDDAPKSDLRLAELFSRYNLKATFNLPGGIKTSKTSLTAEEIKKYIIGGGHEIAVHGEHHLAPGKLSIVDGIREFLGCRLLLEEMFDTIVRGMAYPNSGITVIQNGYSYENIRAYLKDIGIAYSRTLGGDNDDFLLPEDWLAWMPTAHHDNPAIFEYIENFLSIENNDGIYCDNRHSRLFYIWGHSFEFDNNNNWDRMEKICSLLSGRKDIWYATNIEIYDYTEAYRKLISSADGLRIYNPTDTEVWFEDIAGAVYSVKPGGNIRLNSR